MDDKIWSGIWRKLPEISGDTARDESIVGDPLPMQLRMELLRITDRQNDPAPPPFSMESHQEIPSDESRGSGQEKFHGAWSLILGSGQRLLVELVGAGVVATHEFRSLEDFHIVRFDPGDFGNLILGLCDTKTLKEE